MDPPMVLLDRRNVLLLCRSILFVAIASLICASARSARHGAATVAPVPSEVRSTHFLVTSRWTAATHLARSWNCNPDGSRARTAVNPFIYLWGNIHRENCLYPARGDSDWPSMDVHGGEGGILSKSSKSTMFMRVTKIVVMLW
jgi:hypothetical protein